MKKYIIGGIVSVGYMLLFAIPYALHDIKYAINIIFFTLIIFLPSGILIPFIDSIVKRLLDKTETKF